MSRRRDGDEDRKSAFEAAMRGVRPLSGRRKTAPLPEPPPSPSTRDEAPAEFEIVHAGDRLEGRAPGVDRRSLRRLRGGEIPVERRVDLHGLTEREGRAAMRDALLAAAGAGVRCVLVVHGRGSHSPGEPVLKRALPRWLAEAPLGARVLAFASATPRDGGTGATYVWLRRNRGEDPA